MAKTLLLDLLRSHTRHHYRPDKSSYAALPFRDACTIAERTGLSLRQVECSALEAGVLPERYSRNQKSFSNSDQLRLLRSRVVIIGLGGLGGTVTEILARIGVGRLTLVDGDTFDESNLNRQLLSGISTLGLPKTRAAEARVGEINPAVDIKTVEQFFTEKNSSEILRGASLAVDCLDTISDRFILEAGCREEGIPLVSAAIGGASGQATTIFPGDPGLRSIYGPPGQSPVRGIEASVGTLPFAALYMAAVQCSEAVTVLLGKRSELRNRLFIAEVGDHTTELFALPGADDICCG